MNGEQQLAEILANQLVGVAVTMSVLGSIMLLVMLVGSFFKSSSEHHDIGNIPQPYVLDDSMHVPVIVAAVACVLDSEFEIKSVRQIKAGSAYEAWSKAGRQALHSSHRSRW